MTTTLPANFTRAVYEEELPGYVNLTAMAPMSYNKASGAFSIAPASGTSGGIMTTGAQTIAGVKTFSVPPQCSALPSTGADLVTRGYVDQALHFRIGWLESIDSFAVPPLPSAPTDGMRYIASATGSGFTKNRIYTYSATDVGYVETIPREGDSLYVYGDASPSFANQAITWNGTAWISISGVITYASLIGGPTGNNAATLSSTGSPAFADVNATGQVVSTYAAGNSFVASGNVYAAGSVVGNSGMTSGGPLGITAGTASTSTSTGALTVVGGAGIAGAAYIGGIVRMTNATASTSSATGALTVAGGAGIAGATYIGGVARVADTTIATAGGATGALVVAGGIGCVNLVTSGGATIAGVLRSSSVEDATTIATGALRSAGGLGVNNAIRAGSTIRTYSTEAAGGGTAALMSDGGIVAVSNIMAGTSIAGASCQSGMTVVATSAGITTLGVTSNQHYTFTGATTHTAKLASTASFLNGWSFRISNLSTGIVAVITAGSVHLADLQQNTSVRIVNFGANDADWYTFGELFAAPTLAPMTYTATLGGCYAAPCTIAMARSGHLVTIRIPALSFTSISSTVLSVTPPAGVGIGGYGGNTFVFAGLSYAVQITSTGNFSIYRDASANTFTSGQAYTLNAMSFSYLAATM